MWTHILDLVFPHIRDPVRDDPWQRPSEINRLVHREAHDPRCKHVILHVSVPCGPEAFEVVEVHIVLGDLLELAPVGVGLSGREEACGCEC
jgi:hypothetical protein